LIGFCFPCRFIPQSAIRNPQSEIRNPKSEIRNPKFGFLSGGFWLARACFLFTGDVTTIGALFA
jgi:hypothetical protein